MKTTREGSADRENTERGRQRGGDKDNPGSRATASNGKERRRARARTGTKKEKKGIN